MNFGVFEETRVHHHHSLAGASKSPLLPLTLCKVDIEFLVQHSFVGEILNDDVCTLHTAGLIAHTAWNGPCFIGLPCDMEEIIPCVLPGESCRY